MKKDLLRKLPKIDELLKQTEIEKILSDLPRNLGTDMLREVINSYREEILSDRIDNFTMEQIINDFKKKVKHDGRPGLRRVINASGIVIHTNLGRSILSKSAVENVLRVAENYNNLEYDLELGQRGSRYSHIESIIKKVTGAEAAMIVNNNAAAVMLVLDTLCKGKEAVVSRGQLVEIGGSFRVPDVMAFSGAKLIEVGTTNRTHLYDYENNIGENTGVLLKVHTSNFRILGFTKEVDTEELAKLGKKYDIPVVEDIGSGVLVDFSKYGFTYEPTVQESIRKGIDVVTFSGDKMLGGPQAGIIAGKKDYIDKMKKNQLTRALRIDKLTLAALEATFRLYLDESTAVKEIPTLNLLLNHKETHRNRAQRLKRRLQSLKADFSFEIKEDFSMVGGGSMPTEKLETYVIAVKSRTFTASSLEKQLRNHDIPVITRINNEEVILDLRTIFDRDFDAIVEAFRVIGEKNK